MNQRASPMLKAILKDCCLGAEEAESQLHEIAECLRQGNRLGALGAFSGLEDRILYIRAVLMRANRSITATSRERESSKQ